MPKNHQRLPEIDETSEGAANKYIGAQHRGYRSLLLFDERDVGFVTSVFHLVYRNEMKGGGVNDVASAGGRLRVGKDMAKAGITSLVAHLGPLHLVCVIGYLDKEIIRNRFREGRQADFAIELVRPKRTTVRP